MGSLDEPDVGDPLMCGACEREQGPIILVEFKAVMLASLRSLVPKDATVRAQAYGSGV